MASVKMFCSSCDPSTLHIAWWLVAGGCWRSLWRSLLLSCTLVLARIEYIFARTFCLRLLEFRKHIIYFWFCFSKNIRKTQIGEVNINRLILSQQVVKMFWIPASRGRRWWGGDRPAGNCGHCYAPRCWCWCVGVCYGCDTRRCDESCLALLTCSLEVVKSKA